MKKTLKLFGLALMVLTMAGCGKSQTSTSSADAGSSAENVVVNQAEETVSVDYDLTSMSSDMVYATVYQMMMDPENYVGKTVRMSGTYNAVYYEPTKQYYHYCLIQDAAACCAQGIEFVWGDGGHVYPDEYPSDDSGIVVQGVFKTYQEDGYEYCHLEDAVLEAAQV